MEYIRISRIQEQAGPGRMGNPFSKITSAKRAGGVVQVKCVCEALSSIPSTAPKKTFKEQVYILSHFF
jgi:hypothetical protein